MKRVFILKAIFFYFVFIITVTVAVAGTDYPHFGINNIGCDSCHFVYGTQPSLLPPWTVHTPLDIDDTQYNTLCWSCHNDIDAPYVRTHSSLQTDNSSGDWTVECRVCHNPHYQRQFRAYGSESYLYSGASTNVTTTSITKAGAGWTVDQYKDLVVVPNVLQQNYNYKILSNTGDTLTVRGPINLTKVGAGNTFAIVYGKLITDIMDIGKITIMPAKSGSRTVKFSNSTGVNSFADGDATYDGICEVCHTQTSHFRNNGAASDPLHTNMGSPAGTNCTNCHKHENGFRGMGGGAHPTHVTDNNGPQLGCYDCHLEGNIPYLKSGTDGNGDGKYDLSEADVCDNCHSPDGVAVAKPYWTFDPGSWTATEGQAGFCGSCHDATPGNSKGDGTGSAAPDIVGDNITYGFFVNGHGKESGRYQRLSWQSSSALGNPAANRACEACHDLTAVHFNSLNSRLRAGYENDADNSNCRQCHDPGTIAVSDPAWYTTYTDYSGSAHGAAKGNLKCSECHDVHGASGPYPAMTKANQESLCYQCHKDPGSGGIENLALSGTGLANDIQQAFQFGERHNLGAVFNIGSDSYTLECISCHNVHIVTGKHGDAEQGLSPVSRFANNTSVWGDEAGEKMNDFAAKASGSGGWYYSVARGGKIIFDQPAFYQPPNKSGGYNFEFGGEVLPDYATFCLDCHTNRMSAANPPVNWGQGIGCTGNSVDPPDQRIACNAPHGLGSANRPYYWGDVGMYGHSGNPDPIFSEPNVTRGRGAGHFMRWPYDSVNKNAGINFVMSCTDCHEAHGSGAASMLRQTINAYGPGTSNWNTMCNNCHYYYGGHHANMSCGNASCHETNSIHRIIKNGEYSGATYLWTEPSRPNYTPEISMVEGHIGSGTISVTFTEGVFNGKGKSGALMPDDFLFTDGGGSHTSTITGVTHTAGASAAVITVDVPLDAADMNHAIIATRGISVWGTDTACKEPPSELAPNVECPAGPWPVAVTGPGPVSITAVEGIVGSDNIKVTFSEGVYTNTAATGALETFDFVLTDNDDDRSITYVRHTAGDMYAILTLNSPLDSSNDIGVDTLAAVDSAIFDGYDNPVGTSPVIISASACPLDAGNFQLNESPDSVTDTDDSGLLVGSAGNPSVSFPGDGYYHGDELQGTYINFENNNTCLQASTAMTLEARIKPAGLEGTANYIKRILARDSGGNYQMSVWRNNSWPDYSAPDGTASIALWVSPVNTHGGNAWKVALTDYNECPIVSGHWYLVKAVWNTNRPGGVPGQFFVPADIYVDDQGTDGLGAGENWAGYSNCTNDAQSYNDGDSKKLYTGDKIMQSDGNFAIGANRSNTVNNVFNGLIDWIVWKDALD
jgi:predicted CXXCH cytochrome family protein